MKPVAKYVYCQTRWQDLHQWKGAPDQVFYLRDLHRHEFQCKLWVEVSHDDRDVEFIMMKEWFDWCVVPKLKGMPSTKSCEMMCELVAELAFQEFPLVSKCKVEISEDWENGSDITYIR